jgi:hypothetical protein
MKTVKFKHVIVDDDNPPNPHCKTAGDIDGDGNPDPVGHGMKTPARRQRDRRGAVLVSLPRLVAQLTCGLTRDDAMRLNTDVNKVKAFEVDPKSNELRSPVFLSAIDHKRSRR